MAKLPAFGTSAPKDAMIRYQAENGWQTKITPDSRALIKLGLGPRHDGLLNPDSAALASPLELWRGPGDPRRTVGHQVLATFRRKSEFLVQE